jgi:hypothetical protein
MVGATKKATLVIAKVYILPASEHIAAFAKSGIVKCENTSSFKSHMAS